MKKHIQVSLNPELVIDAKTMMKARKFDSLSSFLETLIRQEWERLNPPSLGQIPISADNRDEVERREKAVHEIRALAKKFLAEPHSPSQLNDKASYQTKAKK